MVKRPLKLDLTTCRELSEDCMKNGIHAKKTLKFAVFALFGDFSAENLNKTEVASKIFTKSTSLENLESLHLLVT